MEILVGTVLSFEGGSLKISNNNEDSKYFRDESYSCIYFSNREMGRRCFGKEVLSTSCSSECSEHGDKLISISLTGSDGANIIANFYLVKDKVVSIKIEKEGNRRYSRNATITYVDRVGIV